MYGIIFKNEAFYEFQIGMDFISLQLSYHAGEVTEEHKENAKLKSSATTQLVSQIVLSGGRTISYEYDERGDKGTVLLLPKQPKLHNSQQKSGQQN